MDKLIDGVPCSHPGCFAHRSHPCEGCGRIEGKQKEIKMNFGKAIEALKAGHRVSREGWNGKGMYLYLVWCSDVDVKNLRNEASCILPGDDVAGRNAGCVHFNAHIDMRTADGSICVGWLASQADMLSDDWVIKTVL